MPALPERPPAYPLRHTYPAVRLLVIAALKNKPPLPADALTTGQTESSMDTRLRRIVDHYVMDRLHRDQLKAWARCHEDTPPARGRPRFSGQEASFRELCEGRGWDRATALRNVDRALGTVFMMLNMPADRFGAVPDESA